MKVIKNNNLEEPTLQNIDVVQGTANFEWSRALLAVREDHGSNPGGDTNFSQICDLFISFNFRWNHSATHGNGRYNTILISAPMGIPRESGLA